MSGFIATNPYPVLRCERCGRTLAAADSLCDCDAADEAAVAAASVAGTTSTSSSASAATESSAIASSATTPSAAASAATAVDRATGATGATGATTTTNAEIHICPACGGRFGWRGLRAFHSTQGLPWYRFARFGKACPHCTTPLRSRHPLSWPRRALPAVIMAFILGSHLFGLMPPYDNWLRVGLWCAFLLQLLDNHRRENRDPLAYERDPRWP